MSRALLTTLALPLLVLATHGPAVCAQATTAPALLAASACSSAALAQDDGADLVAEFRQYYGKDREPSQRREAVLTLAGVDLLAATQALVVALQDDEFLVRRAAVDVLSAFRGEDSARWLVDGVILDRKLSKDGRLVAGAAEAVGGMRHDLALWPLVGLLESRDLEVRLGAIAGLGKLGSPEAVAPLGGLAGDKEPAVVVALLDALGRIGDAPAAQPIVLRQLGHDSKTVRLKAIATVLVLRLKDAIRPLIEMIDGDPDPRVGEDALKALQALTLRDFGDDSATWRTWWDRSEASFVLPDLEKIRAAREKLAREGGRYAKGKKSFQDIETKSENILFVIDVSQSMEEQFGDPERLKATGREYKSLQRLEIVKEELIHTIEALPDTTNFNIIAFATEVYPWKKRAVRANVLNRNGAAEWVSDLQPKGSAAAGFRTRSGLAMSGPNLGATNTHLALMTAFGEEVGGRGSNAFVTKVTDPIDTIFFLTDGEPTEGVTVDMSAIREEVRRVNAYRGVQLHVIYVGAFGGKDFEALAQENNGVFVSIGG